MARHSQSDLNQIAIDSAHRFQKAKLELMLSKGWQVQTVKTLGAVTVIVVSFTSMHAGQNGFGYIAPNGLFVSRVHGRKGVTWSWKQMKDYAEAQIPAQGVPMAAVN